MTKMSAEKFQDIVLSNNSLPVNVKVDGDLSLYGCTSLTTLPKKLKVGGDLDLSRCTSLTTLPEGLKVGGDLSLYGCISLTTLPKGLKVGGYLDLAGCSSLRINEYGLGDIGGKVWVYRSFFKDNKDHLLSLVNYKWGEVRMERWYKEALSRG